MGKVLVGNGLEAAVVLLVGGTTHEILFSSHFALLQQLIGLSDACLLVAPFLYQDFGEFFNGLSLKGKQLELISAAKARGDDQLYKPFALTSFGELAQAGTGQWPAMHLNNNLHSKIYLFSHDGVPFAGVVTSANLTRSGLNTSHETGILIDEVATLRALDAIARQDLDYVHLVEHQLKPMRMAAEEYRKLYGADDADVEVGLTNILNRYATPSAGNRDARLSTRARYFIKVSGTRDHPILPEQHQPWSEPHGKLDFAKSPDKAIVIGDCLIEVAVGGQCFLSYHVCASVPHERTELEKASNPDHNRWPFYVFANNLSLHYGQRWFEAPIYVDAVVKEFKRDNPQLHVTQAGGDHIKGAIQMGNSYFQVTKEFGEFVRSRIDAFALPVGKV